MAKALKVKAAKLPPVNESDPRFVALVQAVHSCWGSIASDAEQCAAECGEPMTDEERLEMCLDANRLCMYPGGEAGEAADKYASELSREHGHDALNRALLRHFAY